MQEKSTNELEKMLSTVKPEKFNDYYDKNKQFMADAKRSFYYYMKDTIESKNILMKDIYIKVGVSEKWGNRIITQEKHTKNRDLILGLCLAAHFTLNEINTALKLYEMKPLYARNKRDAIIIVAVNNRIYDLFEINDLLEEQDETKLIIEKEK